MAVNGRCQCRTRGRVRYSPGFRKPAPRVLYNAKECAPGPLPPRTTLRNPEILIADGLVAVHAERKRVLFTYNGACDLMLLWKYDFVR